MAETSQNKPRGRRSHILELSPRDRQAFVEALLDPKPTNDRLRETIRLYREATASSARPRARERPRSPPRDSRLIAPIRPTPLRACAAGV